MILKDIYGIRYDLTITHSNYIICFELRDPVVAKRVFLQIADLTDLRLWG
jgi:hypothetical protein